MRITQKTSIIKITGKARNMYKILVGTPDGKRPNDRPKYGWEENIKMDFKNKG
jgi:hypothetical protein